MTIMRALKQFFRRRPFLGGLAVAATVCLIGNLLPSAWSLLICGLVVLPLVVLGTFWTSSIFDRPVRGFLERYPLVAQVIGLMFVAVLAASAISRVYRAWANGTAYDNGHVLTFSTDPIAFTLWVGGAVLFLLLMIALFGLLAWSYREERLSNQRVRNRPPLDQAIRQPIDER
jgi:hypothetical protein